MKKLPIVRWFDDLRSALSIYIAGNVAPNPNGVTAGKFYFWNGKVRFPTSNISAGETLTDSNMPAVPEGGLNKVNEKIGDLQTGKINKNSSFTQQVASNVLTAFNGVSIYSGYYSKNEELRFVAIWLNLKIPPLTHDDKILELSSTEPAPSYNTGSTGNDANGGGANSIYLMRNSRNICIGATQSTTLNNLLVQLSYFY